MYSGYLYYSCNVEFYMEGAEFLHVPNICIHIQANILAGTKVFYAWAKKAVDVEQISYLQLERCLHCLLLCASFRL